jgi:hypothetical protein
MRLDTRLKAVLGEIVEGGSMLVEADGTPAVVARLPVTDIKDKPVGFGEIHLADYDPEGPVAVLLFRLFDSPTATTNDDPHLVWEVFINPSDAADRRLLEKLAVAQYIHLHVFSTERGVAYIGSKRLNWREHHRAGAQEVLRATTGKRTRWPAAKNRYQTENTLPAVN